MVTPEWMSFIQITLGIYTPPPDIPSRNIATIAALERFSSAIMQSVPQGRIPDLFKGGGHLRSTSKKRGSRRGSNFGPNVKKAYIVGQKGGPGPLGPPIRPCTRWTLGTPADCSQHHKVTGLHIFM